MNKLYTVFFITITPFFSKGQYCSAVGPASNADSNLQSFYLAGESSTAISWTGCPGVIGLDDQTLFQNVILNANTSYTAFAQFGTCGGYYNGVGQAWIDYNQNQIFESTESIGMWSGIPPVPVSTWNFTVPAGAMSGQTRMRVVHFEGGILPIDPCASFTWGSTTDFSVQIGGGTDCSGFVGQNTSDPRIVSALPYSENHSNAVCYFNVLPVYASPDVFYRILPQQLSADYLTFSLCGSTIDTYLTIIDENNSVIEYNDDNSSCGTGSKIHMNVSSHDTLYAVVQGWGYETGNYSLLIEAELASISEQEYKFEVYPNPANEIIFIQSDLLDLTVNLFDLSGKVLKQVEFEGQSTIDVSQLPAGIYLLKWQSENTTGTKLITIE